MERNVNLKLIGFGSIGQYSINADGERLKLKKNKFGSYECTRPVESDSVKIEVYKYSDTGGFWWFLTQILFFIISVFGIFDVHGRKKFICINFGTVIDLSTVPEGGAVNVTLKCNQPRDGMQAIEVESSAKATVSPNVCFVDKKAKKLNKILIVTKLLTFFAVVAAVITAVIYTVIM